MPFLDEIVAGSHSSAAILEFLNSSGPELCRDPLLDDGSLALHVVCKHRHLLSMESVVRAVVDANPKGLRTANKYGFLPIHKAFAAADASHIPILEFLLDTSPDTISAQTIDGQTVYHIAITGPRNPDESILKFLCGRSADGLLVCDGYGQFPLHKAISRPRMSAEVVQLLIQFCPHAASFKDNKGNLPLHLLLCRANPNVETLLILFEHHPSGILEPNSEGQTPLTRYILQSPIDPDLEALLLSLASVEKTARANRIKQQQEEDAANARKLKRMTSSRQSSRSFK